ncbi:MAG: hypothetical protein B6I31_03240 [Desulfobacteraceae bacterium 4572_19]|nr:MAG: hypothetical protein B6I31_03240 [Desulfobacteraceae bacterium 4572_19]
MADMELTSNEVLASQLYQGAGIAENMSWVINVQVQRAENDSLKVQWRTWQHDGEEVLEKTDSLTLRHGAVIDVTRIYLYDLNYLVQPVKLTYKSQDYFLYPTSTGKLALSTKPVHLTHLQGESFLTFYGTMEGLRIDVIVDEHAIILSRANDEEITHHIKRGETFNFKHTIISEVSPTMDNTGMFPVKIHYGGQPYSLDKVDGKLELKAK